LVCKEIKGVNNMKKDSLCNTCKNECKQASFATVMNCPYYEKQKDKE
jgi:hypothetical protein